MELLWEVMSTSFALISSKWTAAHARRFLRGLDYTHLIIQRVELSGERYHYLYTRGKPDIRLQGDFVEKRLKAAPAEQTVHQALELHESGRTKESPSDGPVVAEPKAVALDSQGEVVGFLDRIDSPGGFEHFNPSEGDKPTPIVEAYPALDAPDRVEPGNTFEVHVGFSALPNRRVAQTGKMVFRDVVSTEKCHVVLVADGVAVDRLYADLTVAMDARATFRCQAPAASGEATLTAQYFFRNHLVGIGVRRVAIGAAKPANEPPNPIGLPDANEPLDMTVTVNYLRDGRLQWSWTAPNPGIQTADPVYTDLQDAPQFAADLVRDLKTQNFTGVYAANILETRGQEVADLIPKQLFADLRSVYDAVGRPPTLLLVTNETHVPWELAFLSDVLDPNCPPFLAAQTCMGRWLSDQNVAHPPAVVVDIHEATVVAAEYTDKSRKILLVEALAERAQLANDWNFAPVEADADELAPYVIGPCKVGHLMHFAVHGLSDPLANNQVLILKDGRLLPASALAGRRNREGSPRFAFVFLNACQVGMAGADFGQAAGFPGLLVRAGVHGFIAPLWVVDDGLARGIAERFYQAILSDNAPVGHALRAERARYQKEESTTPLAYVYYGNPVLRLRYAKPQP